MSQPRLLPVGPVPAGVVVARRVGVALVHRKGVLVAPLAGDVVRGVKVGKGAVARHPSNVVPAQPARCLTDGHDLQMVHVHVGRQANQP